MDDARYRELLEKRDSSGLTDDEADELGRLMAEQEGRPYSNADARPDSEPANAGEAAPGTAPIRPDSAEAGPAH